MIPDTRATVPDQMQLAVERTFLAHERTLMAWIRTAISLITFGFTLHKFFQYLEERGPGSAHRPVLGPQTHGRLMIIIGIATLALATWQHRHRMRQLRTQYPEAPASLALWLTGLISGLGILALVATMFRV